MRPVPSSLAISVAIVGALLASGASAQTLAPRHRVHHPAAYVANEPPLTVNKRSWLDPGPVVPQGSMEDYVTENTAFNQTPDQVNQRSRFGNEALPRPLYPTGRPEPVVEFWTPAYPY